MPVSSTAIHALAVAGGSCAAAAPRAGAPGARSSPARPAGAARREVDRRRRRLADEHVVGRDLRRALRAVGRGPADLRERGEHLAGRIVGFCGARVNTVMPNGRRSPWRQPGQHPLHVRRVPGPGEDLARPQQERVPGVVIDRDRARVPLPRQFARERGEAVIASAATTAASTSANRATICLLIATFMSPSDSKRPWRALGRFLAHREPDAKKCRTRSKAATSTRRCRPSSPGRRRPISSPASSPSL